jgi:hypothetical protein
MGLMVWGEGSLLHLTLARSGFWDRRGPTRFTDQIDYQRLAHLLRSGREQEARRAFTPDSGPLHPQQLPCARITLKLPAECRLLDASRDASDGAALRINTSAGMIAVHQADDRELAWVELPQSLAPHTRVTVTHAWHFLGEKLTSRGFKPPEQKIVEGVELITLAPPQDEALTLAVGRSPERLILATQLGGDPSEIIATVRSLEREHDAILSASRTWWLEYALDLPTLDLPDPELMRLYNAGLYRLAGLTHPNGIAASLQGPWMEEYQLPPWSNDYHFNINLQLCYWPVLSCNRTSHLKPLWTMIRSWMPQLKALGDGFFGADAAALMLPHAVDDRCQAIGTFWQGTIDHASTAWIALLAWLDYSHSGDESVLREIAWPLLNGAFNGFAVMIERHDDGSMSLPVSVSPEYGEGAPGTWGANASFQLAAVHALTRALPQAARALGKPIDPRWGPVATSLPTHAAASVERDPWDSPDTPPRERIALWHGQDLAVSHRHHSHLAGIWPFGIFDHSEPGDRLLIDQTLKHWIEMGAGRWCAWCLPWASMICSRTDRPDAAIAWLHWLLDNCASEGDTIGISGVLGAMSNWCGPDDARRKPDERFEIMQLDAHMGLIAAIHELLVHTIDGVIRVLPRVPWRWRECSFDNIGCEGGFRVGATVAGGEVVSIRVRATRPSTLQIRLPGTGDWFLNGRLVSADSRRIAKLALSNLEVIEFRRSQAP